MIIVSQYNRFACVGACIESLLRDNNIDFSHEEFIKNNLDIFNGGTESEGSINTSRFQELADRLNLQFEQLQKFDFSKSEDNVGVFFFVYWNGLEGDKHFVRFSNRNNNVIAVMNPNKPDGLDAIELNWIKGVYRFLIP